jgi:hypothetical protein
MQKTKKLLVAIGVPSMLVSTNLFALTTTLDLSPSGYRDPNSVGGEFTAILSGNNTVSSYVLNNYSSQAKATVNGQTGFETFCVEMTQEFSPGSSYNSTIGPSIVNGSGSSSLSVGVAWLYMEFATGGLANDGYNYNSSGNARELSGDELQDAIWYLQGEIGMSGNGQTSDGLYSFNTWNDPFLWLVASHFGSITAAEQSDTANGESNYGVQVLTLSSTVNGCTVYNQDQLIYCPVPEPATFAAGALLLVPLGLSGLRALRKKTATVSACSKIN